MDPRKFEALVEMYERSGYGRKEAERRTREIGEQAAKYRLALRLPEPPDVSGELDEYGDAA